MGTNTTRFAGSASGSLACGTLIELRLTVTTGGGNFEVDFTVQGGPACYQVTMQTGQPIIPGTTSLGSSCDDCLRPLTFPFPITLYGESQTEALVSSNGNIQFGDTANTAFINNCLPTSALESAVIVYWDDLLTSGGGHGIFTSLTGSQPNRQFVIEWRTGYANRAGNANFEAIFNEGSDVDQDAVRRRRRPCCLEHHRSPGERDSRRPGSVQHGHAEEPRPSDHVHTDERPAATAATTSSTSASTYLLHHRLRHRHRHHRLRHLRHLHHRRHLHRLRGRAARCRG